MSIAPTGDGRVNRPWHRPCPSSAMVNRQASSASASWRCRALSSWSSAISGATTSRTWCASRRSATGSCSAAQPDQVGLGLAAVLDRQRVDALDDHRRLVLGDGAGGHRVPDRFVVAVQGVRQARGGAWRRAWSAGWCWPSSCWCRRHRWRRGRGGRPGVATPELELGDLVPQRGQPQVSVVGSSPGPGRRHGEATRVAGPVELVEVGWEPAATRAATGCASGSPNTVAIQGMSWSRHALALALDCRRPPGRRFRDGAPPRHAVRHRERTATPRRTSPSLRLSTDARPAAARRSRRRALPGARCSTTGGVCACSTACATCGNHRRRQPLSL